MRCVDAMYPGDPMRLDLGSNRGRSTRSVGSLLAEGSIAPEVRPTTPPDAADVATAAHGVAAPHRVANAHGIAATCGIATTYGIATPHEMTAPSGIAAPPMVAALDGIVATHGIAATRGAAAPHEIAATHGTAATPGSPWDRPQSAAPQKFAKTHDFDRVGPFLRPTCGRPGADLGPLRGRPAGSFRRFGG